jgi:hypothetical protein
MSWQPGNQNQPQNQPYGQPPRQPYQQQPYGQPQQYQQQQQPYGQQPPPQHPYQQQQHAAYQQPAQWQPGSPVMIDLATGTATKTIAVAAICCAIGLTATLAALLGAVSGGLGGRIVVLVLGLIFLALGILPLAKYKTLTRPRKLLIEPGGIRWEDPKGAPWAVPWNELAGVAISTATKVSRGQAITTTTTLVRVDLFPGDQGFQSRHPEMAHLWEHSGAKQSYRLPLGPKGDSITAIDNGLRMYAQGRYRGVVDEGIAMGFRYS